MIKTLQDTFKLVKVKMQYDLGLAVTYNESEKHEANTCWIEKSLKSMIHRHPDIDKEADKLKIHVARIFGLMAVGMYKDEEDFNNQEKKLWEETLNSITIVEVNYSGEEERRGISISAKRKILGGKVVKMETPTIVFEDETYMYGLELATIARDFQSEVYQYLFNKKYSQLELFEVKEDVTEEVEMKEMTVA